jgi:hypothetical protein
MIAPSRMTAKKHWVGESPVRRSTSLVGGTTAFLLLPERVSVLYPRLAWHFRARRLCSRRAFEMGLPIANRLPSIMRAEPKHDGQVKRGTDVPPGWDSGDGRNARQLAAPEKSVATRHLDVASLLGTATGHIRSPTLTLCQRYDK